MLQGSTLESRTPRGRGAGGGGGGIEEIRRAEQHDSAISWW